MDGLVGGGVIAGVLIGIKIVERINGRKNVHCGYTNGDRDRDKAMIRTLERIASILDRIDERTKRD